MVATLQSSRNGTFRPYFIQSRNGELFILNGLDRIQRWNGLTAATQDAGITAPDTAMTMGRLDATPPFTGTYYSYLRYKDAEGIVSSLSPISNSTDVGDGPFGFNWGFIPVSTEARVTLKDILRTTDGQVTTLYLEKTIANATTTATSDYASDAALIAAGNDLPILDDDGNPYADRFGIPPSSKRVATELHGRFLYGVSAVYSEGSAALTNGSGTVTIRGGTVTAGMVGRYLFVPGQTTAYLISSISTSNNTLTLSTVYGGTTNLFSDYSIQEAVSNQNSWYFSYIAEPESVYATDSFKLPHLDGDIDSAAWIIGQSMYIAQQRHLWQVAFADNPLEDLTTRHVESRGCINPFCWVDVDGLVFALDQKGIYAFDGSTAKPLSGPIQDVFRRDGRVKPHDYRLNWQTSDRWFAAHSPQEEVVRFHVHLSGGPWPREALCYAYRQNQWWIESYPFGLAGACHATVAGRFQPVYGGRNEILQQSGTFDRTIKDSGTTRGYVTSATLNTLTDAGASFPASYTVGSPVAIVAGTGMGQMRLVASVSGTTITLNRPWGIKPDTTSEYLIGGINWRWKSKIFELPALERDSVRRVTMAVQPTEGRTTADLKLYYNHDKSAEQQKVAFSRRGASSGRDAEIVGWDIQRNPPNNPDDGDHDGLMQWSFDSRGEVETPGRSLVAVEIGGFQGGDAVAIYGLELDGVVDAAAGR